MHRISLVMRNLMHKYLFVVGGIRCNSIFNINTDINQKRSLLRNIFARFNRVTLVAELVKWPKKQNKIIYT